MNLHQLKLQLQSHFSDGMVVVVGSGLSCAEGLPGMRELASHLSSRVSADLKNDDLKIWEDTVKLIESEGLEAALLKKPPNSNLESRISYHTGKLIFSREKLVLDEVFSRKRVLRLTRLLNHLMKPTSGIHIITTNYDRLVEVAVEEAGLGVDTMFSGRFVGKLDEQESKFSFCRKASLNANKRTVILQYQPRAIVYKPHGSIDWYLRDDQPVSYAGELDDIPRLIITPGHNKFRNGYESPFDLHRSRGNEAIDRAGRYLVLGYGFNDDHLETHISPAIRSGKPTLLITRTLSNVAESLARKHSNVIAIDSFPDGGTRVILNREEKCWPDLEIWDLDDFVKNVLEP